MGRTRTGDSKLFQGFFQNLTVKFKPKNYPPPPPTKKKNPKNKNKRTPHLVKKMLPPGYFITYQEKDLGRSKFRKYRKKAGLESFKLNAKGPGWGGSVD